MIDIRQSIQYANYLKSLGWIVERNGETNYFIKRFPLIGSVLKLQRPKRIDFNEIERLSKKYRVFQIIIEPNLTPGIGTKVHDLVLAHGFKLSKNPYLPTKTLHIDLTQSKTKMFNSFKKDARTSIKRGGVINVKEYSTPTEIKIFREGWRKCVNFKRFVPPTDQLINLRKSFLTNNSIFLASHNIVGSIIGGAIFTRSSHDIAYYWQGFTNSEGRTSLSQYSLLYQGILWAKKQKCKIFDLEGIYDSRFPNKSWLGFSHFKRSFGGQEVIYPGAHTKLLFPFFH